MAYTKLKYLKNRKTIIISFITFAIYEGIGFAFNIDLLKIYTVLPSGGGVSILGIVLCAVTIEILDSFIGRKIQKHNLNHF